MRLINSVRIEGMRSVENQSLDKISDLTSFVGKNSSGKSNVLRALSLFFNGEIEPNKPLDFARDHFERIPRSRRKKIILISVDFDLPSSFYLRSEFSKLRKYGGKFTITRKWELDPLRNVIDHIFLEKDGLEINNSSDIARQFLSLILYRYIPNRSIPSQILREESQEIANSVFMRMKGSSHGTALLGQLQAAAARMLSNASNSLNNAGAPLEEVSMATPNSIGEMLSMTGFRAKGTHGGIVQDEDWGTGHQAFFLYQVLYALDTNYARFFGWRQATIWGVEEPESALHRDLETRLAGLLRDWTADKNSRLQILQTTHSPIFTMASDVGYWAESISGATELTFLPIPELTKAAEQKGVSGWMHPALAFPWNPVVLVEGPIDATALNHAASIAGLDHLRFLTLPNLEDGEASGKDALINYMRRNNQLISNRQKHAPLLALLDWEVSDQDIKRARAAYGAYGDRLVLRADQNHADTKMGSDFSGIERFYPIEIIEDAYSSNEINIGKASGQPYSVSSSQLRQAKGKLLTRLLKINDKNKLRPLIEIVKDIDRAIRATATNQPILTGLELY